MQTLIITPKTKVGQVLEAYPQLEDELINISPAFAKLKNPILRKTVAKVASLQQAALVGNVDVSVLVNRLRTLIGQEAMEMSSGVLLPTKEATWFEESKIDSYTNIQDYLEKGEQPIHAVLSALKQLPTNRIHKITAPFVPAPLLDKLSSLGYDYWVQKSETENYTVYVLSLQKES